MRIDLSSFTGCVICGDVRSTIGEDGERLFNSVEVAKLLGYRNPSLAVEDYVDEDDMIVIGPFEKMVGYGGTGATLQLWLLSQGPFITITQTKNSFNYVSPSGFMILHLIIFNYLTYLFLWKN